MMPIRHCLVSSALITPSASVAMVDGDTSSDIGIKNDDVQTLSAPLFSTGSEYLIYYRVDGALFRAVLDTGSPFLTIPGSCGENTRAKSGCYKKQGVPSGLANTFERFDGFEGEVEWRRAPFSFVNATGSILGPPIMTFGVVDDDIMNGPGGVFFGLIKNTDSWIRPTFLGQTSITSFCIDLASPVQTLSLSTAPIIGANGGDFIKMTNDLRRYGDPVQHYCTKAKSLSINGKQFIPSDGRPIYVIFDTGVTGMVVSQQLFNERYVDARQKRETSLWKNVDITFRTAQGQEVSIAANKPLTTPFDPTYAWKRFKGHVMVIGLAFLDGKKFTVDIDDKRLWVE